MLNLWGYALNEALDSFRRTKTISTVSILIMGISLFMLGLFLLLSINVKQLVDRTQEKVEVVAYLEDDLSKDEKTNILLEIRSLDNVETVIFFSKDDALKQFQEEFSNRENLIKSIPFNPLPASFQIRLEQYKTQKDVELLAVKISRIAGVEDVVFGKKWLDRLDNIFNTLRRLSLIIGVLITIASIFIISNTIKMTVFARRDGVQIMRLVGATNWFIRLPFVIEGVLYGIAGSILSIILIYVFYFWADKKFIPLLFLSGEYQLLLVLFGILLGAIGSWVSLQRFLKN